MREISPSRWIGADALLSAMKQVDPVTAGVIENIRLQKLANCRPLPSKRLVDKSNLLAPHVRSVLLDKIASLVDENLTGRSDMCTQYADLLARALTKMGLEARAVCGNVTYFAEGKKVFEWKHGWVLVGDELIDGNIDSASENPAVPAQLSLDPFWGPLSEIPHDRVFPDRVKRLPYDPDVEKFWWPDLNLWVSETLSNCGSLR